MRNYDAKYHKNSLSAVLISIALALLCVLFVNVVSKQLPSNHEAHYKNALYIYMCGSTLETKNAIASQNISEMLACTIPSDTVVIVETGGTRKWRDHNIPEDAIVRYRIANGQLIELERLSNENMGEASTLSSFLEFCNRDYDAENTTLLFWNHGAGSIDGVCLDENYSCDGLTPAEMNEAFDATNAHFNTVCFDACLMANYETMRVVCEHANTMIASEEIEPAAGWNYKTLVEHVGSDTFTNEVLDSYREKCENKGKTLYTLSAVDLTKFWHVETVFNTFCNDILGTKAAESDLGAVSQAALASMGFGEQEGSSNQVDLAQFARNLNFDSLEQEIKDCVQVVNGQSREGACGISIYFPVKDKTSLANYLVSETHEAYALFLGSNFVGSSTNKQSIQFKDAGSVSGTTFHFSLTPSSATKVQSVIYDVYQLAPDYAEPANCIGFANDVTATKSGSYSIDFSGYWVSLNGQIVSIEPIDTVGNVTVFCAPVKVNGTTGNLRFTYNATTDEFALQGFVPDEARNTQALESDIAGRLEDIVAGDQIVILSEKFKNNESLETEYKETATIIASENLVLSKTLLPDGEYQMYAIVTDIYGNEYTTTDCYFTLTQGAMSNMSVDGEDAAKGAVAGETAAGGIDVA